MPHPARRWLTVRLHRSRLGRRIGRDTPFVSAVVAASDLQAPYLAECLDSLRAQTRQQYEIIVVPYGKADDCVAIAERYSTDWRFEVAPSAETYGGALNAGARRAQGEFLTFVGAADTVPADAFELLVGTLQSSGSDFAVGNAVDVAPAKHLTRSEHGRAHDRDRIAVTLAQAPNAPADLLETNRMFRRRFWSGAGLEFPESPEAPIGLPIEHAYLRARTFDLLRRATYRWTRRGDGVPFGYLRPVSPGLPDWRAKQRTILTELEGQGATALRDAWLYSVLDTGIRPYVGDVERLDERGWALLRGVATDLWDRASDDVRMQVRAEPRVAAWLAAHGMRNHLERYVAQRWFEHGQVVTDVRGGVAYARLPYADEELDVPREYYALAGQETPTMVSVQRLNWTENHLRLDLFCYVRNVPMCDEPPDVTVALVRGDERLDLDVRVSADPAVTRHAGQPYQCYDHGAVTASLPLSAVAVATRGDWTLQARIRVGGFDRTSPGTQLAWQGSAAALRTHRDDAVEVRPRWKGDAGLVLAVADAPGSLTRTERYRFVVDEVALDGTTLDIYGRWNENPPEGWTLALESPRIRIVGGPPNEGEDRDHVRIQALTDPWSHGQRPAPPGAYHLTCVADDPAFVHTPPVDYADDLLDRLPYDELGSVYRLRPRRSPHGRPVLELNTPLGPDEQGPHAQYLLQEAYAAPREIDENAVYLQSYVGQSATDSPLAIHQALRQQRPDLNLYWGVADFGQWVPDGGVPVLMHSRAWYELLATARYVVSNIDFERWFVPRVGQQVLQTYHGFPSKTMGLPLWREKRFTPRRMKQQLARTSDLWDALLTPTPEVNRYYRDAFRYQGPILDRGYPRDDVLASPEAPAVRISVRERLGIGEDQVAVLYAPTWRDDVATGYRSAPLVPYLDVQAAAKRLGPGYVLLLRGHRFHEPESPAAANVIDVTLYPEINDLILASDAAVLDYSSLRFDYAVTRKPMIFLVPDLDAYMGGVRGFLYDFRESAPGPLVADTDAVVERLHHLDDVTAEYAAAYDAFNATYNRWQDGQAAQRVVDTFFAHR